MALAYIPIIKALGPYLLPIINSAIPAFTSKAGLAKSDPVVAQQVQELQDAVIKNAESLQTLAEQLQKLVLTAEAGAAAAKRQVKIYQYLALGSALLSLGAMALTAYGLRA